MNNVTKLPEPPRRCEFPHCPDKSDGMVKKFHKHLCSQHRKLMLLADSFLTQVEDEEKSKVGAAGIIDRLHAATQRAETHYVVDKKLMDEVKGMLLAQEQRIAELEAAIRK